MPEYVGTRKKSEEWGVPQSKISQWCRDGLIPGVVQDEKGCPWRIPVNACRPDAKKGGKAKIVS